MHSVYVGLALRVNQLMKALQEVLQTQYIVFGYFTLFFHYETSSPITYDLTSCDRF